MRQSGAREHPRQRRHFAAIHAARTRVSLDGFASLSFRSCLATDLRQRRRSSFRSISSVASRPACQIADDRSGPTRGACIASPQLAYWDALSSRQEIAVKLQLRNVLPSLKSPLIHVAAASLATGSAVGSAISLSQARRQRSSRCGFIARTMPSARIMTASYRASGLSFGSSIRPASHCEAERRVRRFAEPVVIHITAQAGAVAG